MSKEKTEELLVKIEIDAENWPSRTAKEKLRILWGELRKNGPKLVDTASNFVGTFGSLIRAATKNRIVGAYLDALDTMLGLVKLNTIVNNVFVAASHEVKSPYDPLAAYMDVRRGVDLQTSNIPVTSGICKAFVGMDAEKLASYGVRFMKVKQLPPETDTGDKGEEYNIVAEVTIGGHTGIVGIELGYCISSCNYEGVDIANDENYSFMNFGMERSKLDPVIFDGMSKLVYRIYIDSIDISKNVIRIKNGSMFAEPRKIIDFDIKNFDLYDDSGKAIRTMKSEAEFIRKVLDGHGRRGYIIQGDQGTGKTVSVNRLLMEFPDVPVFWITPESISDKRGMINVFKILTMFPGSFFVFDDFDGNDFSTKNERTGAFINFIDETNSPNYRGITILIINEPQKLHSTIKNRPKRIDDIIYVQNPKTVEDVIDVIEQTFIHLKADKPGWVSADSAEFTKACNQIFESGLTHAYISGIICDMVNYYEGAPTAERFLELVNRRIVTMKYSRMVARDDGHIIDGPPPSVPSKTEEKKINSDFSPEPSEENESEM